MAISHKDLDFRGKFNHDEIDRHIDDVRDLYTDADGVLRNHAQPDGWFPLPFSVVYNSADAPSFVIKITGQDLTSWFIAGMYIRLTHSSATKYFILTKVALSGSDTLLTLYGGTDYTLTNSAITDVFWAPPKSGPIGFDLNPAKWTEQIFSSGSSDQTPPTQNVWYNSDSLDVPIGIWRIFYKADHIAIAPAVTSMSVLSTLSTGAATQSDTEMTTAMVEFDDRTIRTTGYAEKFLDLSTKATYYLNKSTSLLGMTTIRHFARTIRAISNYI